MWLPYSFGAVQVDLVQSFASKLADELDVIGLQKLGIGDKGQVIWVFERDSLHIGTFTKAVRV